MLQPKKTKFAKFHKVRVSGVAQVCSSVSYGSFGLVVCDNVKINGKQLESIRKVLSREMNRAGAIFTRVFPQLPVTKKPVGTRMGGGKSGVENWVIGLQKGTILVEIDNVSEDIAIEALSKARFKISVPCSIVRRRFAYL